LTASWCPEWQTTNEPFSAFAMKFSCLPIRLAFVLAGSSAVYAEDPPQRAADGEPSAGPSVIFQKEIAPFIAQSRTTYPQARKRYEAGLPKTHVFYVAVRQTDRFGQVDLLWLRVSRIDEKKSEVTGRIGNEKQTLVGYSPGDRVSCPETDVVDWKISHPDGTEEGNVLGKYLASLGPDADVRGLLQDQREADMLAMQKSPAVDRAFGETFLQLFGDADLKVERVESSPSTIVEWPALTRKYHDVPSKRLLAELQAKAAAIKATKRVTVEESGGYGNAAVVLAAYVVTQKNHVVYEVRQFLHLNYDDKDKLDKATWGLRSIRTVQINPAANQPVPPPAKVAPPVDAPVTPPSGATGLQR
jgi:hypothetical protein